MKNKKGTRKEKEKKKNIGPPPRRAPARWATTRTAPGSRPLIQLCEAMLQERKNLNGEGSLQIMVSRESPLPPPGYHLYVAREPWWPSTCISISTFKKSIVLRPRMQIKIRLYRYVHFNKSSKTRSHSNIFCSKWWSYFFKDKSYFICHII